MILENLLLISVIKKRTILVMLLILCNNTNFLLISIYFHGVPLSILLFITFLLLVFQLNSLTESYNLAFFWFLFHFLVLLLIVAFNCSI